jgi:hypothetical protein
MSDNRLIGFSVALLMAMFHTSIGFFPIAKINRDKTPNESDATMMHRITPLKAWFTLTDASNSHLEKFSFHFASPAMTRRAP